MKALIILVATMFTFGCANAQKIKEGEVPQAVKTKFHSLYPTISDVDWEKENGGFEAGFELNKVETSCVFDASGNLQETETEIAVADLPQAVKDYMAKNCAGQKIKEAAKLVDANGKITFEAEAGDADYVFDDAGNFIKKVVEAD